MTAFALRGLLLRKLRTALTGVAILLGVAMISGTYVLTDSISNAFDAIFTQTYRGTDAVVSGKSAFNLSDSGTTTDPSFEESLLPKVQALPDVDAALGGVAGEAQLIGRNGKAIVFGGAPNLGFSVDPTQARFNSLTLVSGSWPKAGEVVVDRSTAGKKDIAIGQQIGVQAQGPVERLRVSGLVKFGAVSTIGGATLAGFDLKTAQHLFAKVGRLDQIRVAAKKGVSPQKLQAEIRSILPPGTQVRSGNQQATSDAKDTNSFVGFLQKFLLSFGGVALFVGAFVIANSLSITIAQRTREFATLRTIGASRRQVLRAVILEALTIGVLASVIGLFVGLALAKGLFKLFDAVGFTLPNNGLTLETRTIVVALVVGILVTLGASLRPALRATRVPPIAAVREGAELPPGRFHRFRGIGAAATALLGFAALAYGLFGSGLGTTTVLLSMGVGALLIFVGVALFSSRIVVPLAHAIGFPATRVGGAAGVLARDNAQRNPQRTASTAAALMIGLALVTLVATLAASIIGTFNSAVDDLAGGEFYAITAQNNYSPIPVSAAEAAANTPGLDGLASVRAGDVQVFGNTRQMTAVDPTIGKIITLNWKKGSQAVFANLGESGAFIDDGFAKNHDLSVGSGFPILTPTGRNIVLTVEGIFKPPAGGSPFGPVTISSKTFDANYAQPENLFTFVTMRGGVTDANKSALEQSLAKFPNAKVADGDQFKKDQASGLKSTLNILYVLLALSILVSLFGIVNALVLTVFERTRELGMLRAIGMTRRQVRRMIRAESVITSLIGATIGIVLGLVLAALLIVRVDEINFFTPWGQVVVFLVAAILVGIVAAIFPARRAARLNPLEALQYE
ncbi:MAG: FtsX-like permease family protein [Acidobacteria bacterium]|nr:FtsX-like permease family protein [Acidobacteriota bacterium]